MVSPGTGKKICFISARAGFVKENQLRMDWANGRLINELLKTWPDMTVAVFSNPHHDMSYELKIDTDSILELPFPYSYPAGIANTIKILAVLRKIDQTHDVLIIQLPFIGFASLFLVNRPVVYHLCANVLTASANPFKYKGITLFISTLFARLMTACHRYLFSKEQNKLIVNGVELGAIFNRFRPRVVVSSSIMQDEIIDAGSIQKRDVRNTFRLLFIGRPSKEKGINILIQAFQTLIDKGQNVRLTMIGVQQDELIAELVDFKMEEKYLTRIEFNGFISWGELFRQKVQASHCLLMCSISEGTPRVIIESMALGCPVIASNVGGVPTVIRHGVNGLLFTSGAVAELISSITMIMEDEEYRQTLARNALLEMKNFTVEKFSENFRDLVELISSSK